MPLFFFHLRDGMDELIDPEGIQLPNLEAAKACAMKNAYSIMAADTASGKLDLNLQIDIADAAGNVLHTVRFRDLVEIVGLAS